MNLHAFYRKESVGDILLVRLFNEGTTVSYEKKDDHACIVCLFCAGIAGAKA